MALLTCANVVYAIGDRRLLDGANLTLEPGEHVGLVGRNGTGKSTLLKLIANEDGAKPLEGSIQLVRGTSIAYHSQHPHFDFERTLLEEARSAFGELDKIHRDLESTYDAMAEADGDEMDRLMKKAERLQQEIEAAGGYAVDHQVEAALHGLGLTDNLFNVKVKDLSGGQKGRLGLAKILLAQPDLLLLDEPTNHLDIAGREWLEEYLRGFAGAVLMVSHDRWMLDNAVSAIYELDRGRLEQYPGNFAKYKVLRAERRLAQQRVFEKQQTKVKQEQQFIDRYRAGQRASQAQGREKRLERYKANELVEAPQEMSSMSLRFSPSRRSGDIVAKAQDVTKGYEGKPLFEDFNFVIKRGDRIGIIGPNGAGKSTLVRCLLGEQPIDSGRTQIGASIDLGYYRQAHENIDLTLTVVEYLKTQLPNPVEQEARDLAGAFLFTGQEQDKVLNVMSGGERSRAVLAGIVSQGHNLLILDEPTNHLDIPSAERLEAALKAYVSEKKGYGAGADTAGTLLLITHDRMLLEHLVDQLIVLDGEGNIEVFQGTYSDYHEAQKNKPAAPVASKPKKKEQPKPAAKASDDKPRKVEAKSSVKGPKKTSRFGKMSQSHLEAEIEKLESEKKQVDADLANPDVYQDGDKVKALQDRRAMIDVELEPLEEEWASRAED